MKKRSSFKQIDRMLSRRATRVITDKVPPELLLLIEQKIFLSGDVHKKIQEINDKLREQCTHGLLLEIPRRRIEPSPGQKTRVVPPTRVCLVCGQGENAVQNKDRGGRLKAVFKKFTAKPVGVVREDYGAITIGLFSSNRPLADYVKATLAARYPKGKSLIDKIMYPNTYSS